MSLHIDFSVGNNGDSENLVSTSIYEFLLTLMEVLASKSGMSKTLRHPRLNIKQMDGEIKGQVVRKCDRWTHRPTDRQTDTRVLGN